MHPPTNLTLYLFPLLNSTNFKRDYDLIIIIIIVTGKTGESIQTNKQFANNLIRVKELQKKDGSRRRNGNERGRRKKGGRNVGRNGGGRKGGK